MYRFTLSYTNRDGIPQSLVCEEPKRFTDIVSHFKRDLNTHGVFFSYTERDIPLEFKGEGKDFIETAYQEQGTNAKITLTIEFRETPTSEWELVDMSLLNMKTRNLDADFLAVSVSRQDLLTKFRDRLNTTVDISQTESIEGVALDEIVPQEILFHSKEIFAQSRFEINEEYLTHQPYADLRFLDVKNTYIIPFNPTLQEIQGTTIPSPGPELNNVSTSPQIFYAGLEKDRVLTLNLKLLFGIKDPPSLAQGGLGNTIFVELEQRNADTLNSTVSPIESFPTPGVNTEYLVTYNATITIGRNNALIIRIRFDGTNFEEAIPVQLSFNPENSFLEISENSQQDSSTLDTYAIPNVIQRNLEIITDTPDILSSDFLNQSPFHNLHICTGKTLRGFEEDNSPQFSFSEAFEAINCLHPIGYGLEKNEQRESKIRIENFEYFYRDELLLHFPTVTNWREETADDLLFNKLEIGFENYAKDENQTNSIDDIHTQHEYLFPFHNVKNEKKLLCPWIASAYLIERTRRESFEETKSESFRYDDNIFLIQTIGNQAEKEDYFLPSQNIFSPETMYNLRWSPKQLLLNWGVYWNSLLYYNDEQDIIRNQKTLLNGKAITQFQANAPGRLGDEQALQRTQNGFERQGTMYSGSRVFQPDYLYFERKLSFAEKNFIQQAHEGALPSPNESKNYGYISFDNGQGETLGGWVVDIAYNFVKRTANFKLLKKATVRQIDVQEFGILWEQLGGAFITTEDGRVISLE